MTEVMDFHSLLRFVRYMGGIEKRSYQPQYLCEEEIFSPFLKGFCDNCYEILEEKDINTSSCPCNFDYSDISCSLSFQYDKIKELIILADMIFRSELGEYWSDGYSDMLRRFCLWEC